MYSTLLRVIYFSENDYYFKVPADDIAKVMTLPKALISREISRPPVVAYYGPEHKFHLGNMSSFYKIANCRRERALVRSVFN